jgi:DnaJ-class molecular chaperone
MSKQKLIKLEIEVVCTECDSSGIYGYVWGGEWFTCRCTHCNGTGKITKTIEVLGYRVVE